MLLAAALVGLAVPSAASAQGALLDGAPLNVFADGLGAIQVRQDGLTAGLFYDPDENPGHAGLEIKEGSSYYPLIDGFSTAPGRVSNEPITTTVLPDGSQLMHTSYRVGPHLLVGEDIAYVNGTSVRDDPLRDPERQRQRRLAARGRGRRPLRRQQRQWQRRHLAACTALRRWPRRDERARLRPARDHPLAHLPGGRLRARLQQLLRRRPEQHGGRRGAGQRRGGGLRARPRAGRDQADRRAVAARGAGPARHRPGNGDQRERGGRRSGRRHHRRPEARRAAAAGPRQVRQHRRPQGSYLRQDPAQQEVRRAQGPDAGSRSVPPSTPPRAA